MLIVSTNKERYRVFCENNRTIPLFLQAWWMEAACIGKSWDVLLYEEKGEIVAFFVFHHLKKHGFKVIVQPQLTQYSGLWINYPDVISASKKVSLEKKIMTYFIEQLDALGFTYFELNFHPSVTNWLPFYWNGFEQTTRYTYRINDISNADNCFSTFAKVKQQHILNAEKKLRVDFSLSGKDFYLITRQNLLKNKQQISYAEKLFLSLYNAAISRKQAFIIAVRDENDTVHAATFIVWNNVSAYYLITTINPDFRGSGASSLMVWTAIKTLSQKVKAFDFEGSMSENIEHSFRQFGGEQTPYFKIYKHKSALFKMFWALRRK